MSDVLLFALVFAIYWVPFYVAAARKTQNVGGVFVINLFLGWTFIGWVIALAMAAGGAKKTS